MIVDHHLARLAALPGPAPAHALPIYLPREVEIVVKSIAVPVLGLVGLVTGLASRALTSRAVCGRVDEGAFSVASSLPPLPVCGLAATRTAECARALGVTVRSHDDCVSDRLAVARPGVTARCHTGPATGHVTVTSLVTALLFLLIARSLGRGVGALQ